MKKNIVISLFDYSGVFVKPWLDAGYECWIVDNQHKANHGTGGVTQEGSLFKLHFDLRKPWLLPFDRSGVAFVAAFPPCDHLAVSGSRWLRGKGLRLLAESIELFATAAEMCEWIGAPYLIENPVSTISTYWRKPDHVFSQELFTGYCADDNYTKKTCLWTGNGFVMPHEFRDESLGPPDDRIHKCPPGEDRKNIRSKTPLGFAIAVQKSNGVNLNLCVA
jgi:hypothetical protein